MSKSRKITAVALILLGSAAAAVTTATMAPAKPTLWRVHCLHNTSPLFPCRFNPVFSTYQQAQAAADLHTKTTGHQTVVLEEP